MEETAREAAIKGQQQAIKGADFTITGDVAEFGRKETGDVQLYGVAGAGKVQTAYSKVNLNIVQGKRHAHTRGDAPGTAQ